MTIIAAIQAGAALFKQADGLFGPKAQPYIDAGTAIVSTATGLYSQVKADLAPEDVATVDAELQAAHDRCGPDLARALTDLEAAAAR